VNDLWTDVKTFNAACGVRLRETSGWVSDEEIALALRLIKEERDELLVALVARNMVEAADAIADSLYVRAGLLLRLGLARTYIHDLLPKSTSQPMWADFDATHTMAFIGDELELYDRRIAEAVEFRSLNNVDVEVHSSMYHLTGLAMLLHLPMDRVWAEVQNSNMSKLFDGKVIRRADGKIQKGPDFRPPEIERAIFGEGMVA